MIKKKILRKERENPSTYLLFLDYINVYYDVDRKNVKKKLRNIWRTLTFLEVLIFRRKLWVHISEEIMKIQLSIIRDGVESTGYW